MISLYRKTMRGCFKSCLECLEDIFRYCTRGFHGLVNITSAHPGRSGCGLHWRLVPGYRAGPESALRPNSNPPTYGKHITSCRCSGPAPDQGKISRGFRNVKWSYDLSGVCSLYVRYVALREAVERFESLHCCSCLQPSRWERHLRKCAPPRW